MAEFKVVVSDYILPDMEIERQAVEAIGAKFVVGQCANAAELIELAHDADAMFNTYFGPLSDEVFTRCPKLKIVVRFGIGYDTIDVEAATRHGVMAVNVPDYCIDEVSDHAIGLWLALGRKIVAADRMVRRGEWGMKPFALPENATDAPGQIYNLATDPGETKNLYYEHPGIVKRLKEKLEEFKKSGRSRPATDQSPNIN